MGQQEETRSIAAHDSLTKIYNFTAFCLPRLPARVQVQDRISADCERIGTGGGFHQPQPESDAKAGGTALSI